jgi:phosphoribosylaminoimidazole-succinocarboxamide synthase
MEKIALHLLNPRSWFLPLDSGLAAELHIGELPHQDQLLLKDIVLLPIDLILRRMRLLSFMKEWQSAVEFGQPCQSVSCKPKQRASFPWKLRMSL